MRSLTEALTEALTGTRRRRARGERGLTLIELVVAVLVLALGSLAALRAADQSRLAIGGSEARVLALLAARNRLEELRLYGAGGGALPAEATLGGQVFTLETETAVTAGGFVETTVTARAAQGPGARLTAWLPRGAAR